MPSPAEQAAKTCRRSLDVTTTALLPDRTSSRLRRSPSTAPGPRRLPREGKAGGKTSFSKQVQPLLQANCYGCHQPAKAKGDYQMTTLPGLLRGGESGSPAVVPGKPEKSQLLELITPSKGKAEMPKAARRWPPVILILSAAGLPRARKTTARRARGRRSMPTIHPSIPAAPWLLRSISRRMENCSPWPAFTRRSFGRPMVRPGWHGWWACRNGSKPCDSPHDGTKLLVVGGIPCRSGEVQVWDVASHKLLGRTWSASTRCTAAVGRPTAS